MNNTIVAKSTVIQNEADQVLLDNWMAEVRAYQDDPRAATGAGRFGGDFPEWPLAVSAWVETVEFRGIHPEVNVTFHGKEHVRGGFTAGVEEGLTIFVDDFRWDDGTVEYLRGEVLPGTGPRVFVPDHRDNDFTAHQATDLADVIMSAAAELLSFEAAAI